MSYMDKRMYSTLRLAEFRSLLYHLIDVSLLSYWLTLLWLSLLFCVKGIRRAYASRSCWKNWRSHRRTHTHTHTHTYTNTQWLKQALMYTMCSLMLSVIITQNTILNSQLIFPFYIYLIQTFDYSVPQQALK